MWQGGRFKGLQERMCGKEPKLMRGEASTGKTWCTEEPYVTELEWNKWENQNIAHRTGKTKVRNLGEKDISRRFIITVPVL